MKKHLIIFSILSLLLVFGAAACVGDGIHRHDYDVVVTAATCTEGGYSTRICKTCGYSEKFDFTDPTDHDYAQCIPNDDGTHTLICANDPQYTLLEDCELSDHVIAPSCLKGGYTEHTCEKCGYATQDTPTDPLEHEFGPWTSLQGDLPSHEHVCTREGCGFRETMPCAHVAGETVKPTCESDGYTVYTCPDCEAEYHADPVPATGHIMGPAVSDNQGKHTSTCTVCGTEETDVCSFREEEGKLPSCTEDGYTLRACEVCHFEERTNLARTAHSYGAWHYDGGETHTHTRTCEECGGEEQAACSFTSVTHTPTCTEAGYTEHTCDECDSTHTHEGAPATGHSYGAWEDDETAGQHSHACLNGCGEIETEPCDYAAVTHSPTCTEDGSVVYTCPVCKDSYTEKGADRLGHDFPATWDYAGKVDGKDTHEHVCRRENCNEKESGECSVKRIEDVPTCDAPADIHDVCEECHHTEDVGDIEKLDHDWGTGWSYAGTDEEGRHIHRRVCTRNPEHVETEVCNFDISVIDATCEAGGKTVHTCPTCNKIYEDNATDALGHHYGNWVYDEKGHTHVQRCLRENCENSVSGSCTFADAVTEATCDEGGFTTHTCETCGGSYTDAVTEKLGHLWGKPAYNGEGKHQQICEHDSAHVQTLDCNFTPEVTEATCESGGYTTYTCEDCGGSYKKDETPAKDHTWTLYQSTGTGDGTHGTHFRECTACHTREEAPCSYDEKVTPATCTEDSFATHTCTVCGEQHTHITPSSALGHRYGAYTCDRAAGTHSRQCLNAGCREVETSACEFDEVIFHRDATCSSYSHTTSKCVCGNTQTVYGSRLPHEMTGWITGKYNDGRYYHLDKCKNCDYNVGGLCSFVETTHDAICEKGGYIETKCTICGRALENRLSDPLGHDWSDYEYTGEDGHNCHTRTCRRAECDETETHDCTMVEVGSAATCLTPADAKTVCSECSHTDDVDETPALGHAYPEKWEYMGVSDGVHMNRRVCANDPSHFELQPCVFTVHTTDPDCTHVGTATYVCDLCVHEYTEQTSDSLHHVWEEEFECNETGHLGTCTLCGFHEFLPHDYHESNLCAACGYDGLTYRFIAKSDSYEVVSDSRVPNAKRIVIPAAHEDRPVTSVSYYTFDRHAAVTEVVLPASLETIEIGAFYRCANLKSVTFSGEEPALRTIGYNDFMDCTALAEFALPEGLEEIGDSVFRGCAKYTPVLPDGVTSIGANAFTGCKAYLEESWADGAFYLEHHLIAVKAETEGPFAIRANTLHVAAGAFAGCKGITRLEIPASVLSFGKAAFDGCTSLAEVEYHGKVAEWFAIRFVDDLSSPMHYASGLHIEGAVGNIVLPEDLHITYIPAGTFRGTQITGITIPASVKEIGANAFLGCASLMTIVLPDSVERIGENAFKDCGYALDPASWTGDVLYIGNHLIEAKKDGTFEDGICTVRKGTLTIAPRAFAGCSGLRGIIFSDELVRIGAYAFENTNLATARFASHESYTYSWFCQGIIGRQHALGNFSAAQFASQFKFYYLEWRRV